MWVLCDAKKAAAARSCSSTLACASASSARFASSRERAWPSCCAACVPHSTEDPIADGSRPIVVREAVGDRILGAVEWNLFDIDAKFGDVMGVDEVISYLNGIEHFDGNTVVA